MACDSRAASSAATTVVHAPARMTVRRSRGRGVVIRAFGTAAAAGALAGNRAMAQTLAVGGQHVCVITTTGGVKCWGANGKGQLGYEDTGDRGKMPRTMGDALRDVNLGAGRVATSITAGHQHTCAVLDNATLKCWGDGSRGKLGQENTASYGSFTGSMGDALRPIKLGTGRTAIKAVGGDDFTCVLRDDYSIVCFGKNESGQLGVGNTVDVGTEPGHMGDALARVDLGSGPHRVVDLTSGPCALLSNGHVKCWGSNVYGNAGVPGGDNVGTARRDMGDALSAIDLGSGLAATSITSGANHNCAVVRRGAVKCWGKNTQGNLGLGDVHDRGDDVRELGDELPFTALRESAVRLEAGDDHTCALLAGGAVQCWGHNFRGSLGLGDYRTRGDAPGEMGNDLPTVDLGDDPKVVDISAGGSTSCALFEDGTVKCWGKGDNGVLAQGRGSDIGDDRREISRLKAINIGTGVLVATRPIPTLSPTVAPTMPRTPAPSVPATALPAASDPISSPRGQTATAPPAALPTEPTPSPVVDSTAGDLENRPTDDQGANDHGSVGDVAVNSADSNGSGSSARHAVNWALISVVAVAVIVFGTIGFLGLRSVRWTRKSQRVSDSNSDAGDVA